MRCGEVDAESRNFAELFRELPSHSTHRASLTLMPFARFPTFVALAMITTATIALSPARVAAQSATARLRVPVTVDTLPNGLTLIVHEDHSVPTVATNVWFHVGSSDEQPGRTGFAHLFEHLMFMGSEHAPYPQFDRLLESAGASNNGTTNNDRTAYYEWGPSNALPLMLWLEADRLGWLLPTMDSAKLDAQREVVKNERRQGVENQPYGIAEDLLAPALYPASHPYSWPVIGSMADLSAASLDDVKAFFRRYYTPNNAVIVIAGAVRSDSVRAAVRQAFADIPRGPAITRPAPVPFTLRDTVMVAEDQVQLPRLYVSWRAVPQYHADDAALNVARYLLTGARNARLTNALVYEQEIAKDVSAGNDAKKLAGDFGIVVTARPGVTLNTLQQAIDQQIARLAAEGPTARELEQARNAIEAGFLNRLEFVNAKAEQLNEYYYFTGTPDYFQRDLDRYRAVTADDVKRVVATYLQAPRVLLSIVPGGKPELAATRLAGGASTSAARGFVRDHPPTLGDPTSLVVPSVGEDRLANGLTLSVVEQRELPVVQLIASFTGGSRLDGTTPGIAAFTANMLDEGAGGRDAAALQSALAYLGASLQTGADWDRIFVSLKVPVRSLGPALDLMADVIRRPALSEVEVRRQRDLRLANLLQQRDQPGALADLAFNSIVFPAGHPYHNSAGGDSAAVASLDSSAVRAFYARAVRPANARLVIVGDLAADDARAEITRRFGDWSGGGGAVAVPPVTVAPRQQEATTVYLVDKPHAAQSVISIGWPGVDRRSPDYAPLMVMNSLLGGSFTSRLNMNLRETHGYTYGASSRFSFRTAPGPFIASASVRTDVTDSSLVEFFRELRVLRDSVVPTDELQRARSYVELGLPGSLESTAQVASTVAQLATFALPLSDLRDYAAQVRMVTAADIMRVARQYLTPDRATVVVVGDLAKVRSSIAALQLGAVKELEAARVAR